MLRLGLAFVFLYAGIAALLHPLEWEGYLPGFIGSVIDPELALKTMAVYETVLGIWLLIGRYRKYAAALVALTLSGITLLNLSLLIITFRDVGLVLAAVALFLMPE